MYPNRIDYSYKCSIRTCVYRTTSHVAIIYLWFSSICACISYFPIVNKIITNYFQTTEEFHQSNAINQEELEAHKKLIKVYKSSAEDSENKVEELISAVQELQGIVKASMKGKGEVKLLIQRCC